MAHGPADNSSEHITAFDVGRNYAVGDQERHRTPMLCENSQRNIGLAAGSVCNTSGALGLSDYFAKEIDIPDSRDTLQHCKVAL